MGIYPLFLTLISLVGAACAGFILAQSHRQRATQLAGLLAAGAAWWAQCESRWNAAPDAAIALHWMRLSTPGWVFIPGLVPHLVARYLDVFPSRELARWKPWLMRAAGFAYVGGLVLLPFGCWDSWVWSEVARMPWGWSYAPGPAQLVYFAVATPPPLFAVFVMRKILRSSLSVAPRPQRVGIQIGVLTPIVLIGLTEMLLPIMRVPFPRLGSIAYALFGLAALGTALRYGLSFFTPRHFSEEILDTLQEGVVMITPKGVIRRANRGLVRLTGHHPEALVGLELQRVLAWQPPEDQGVVEAAEARLSSAEGDSIPVSVSAAPLRDHRGNAMGVVVVIRDLREIEELQRRIVTQSRLAAVGELAAGLAHEINNPLAFVRANLAQLERHWETMCESEEPLPREKLEPIAEEGRELIEESLDGVDRAAEIVRGVRRFTHAGNPARERADLNELLENARAMLRPQIQSSEVSVNLRLGPLPHVLCAPQELRQVFLNLLMNAIDAVGGRGRVEVSTHHEAGTVTVEISDDGRGIPPELMERIFTPFFTTKRVGEGTGLGLGIAWHIVEAHGGRIDVDSLPGVGTTFRVRLPIGDPTSASRGSPTG